ncbi:phosphotransferase [Pseudemcibacter aquimaris]|uniref:phosphotransferase n=1 Tax=Pseudemcibacter aquimaris TaxID=2857064 RepID=UPI0020119FBB|nr:phosphotransferase [Pseudemcibacter aquimaris]MCC3861229.1 phosphotransferase [Pseudemcibacter aquimaris]WDU58004.1 phosphotransferase [Pseudemcibacter aquimaris]
MKEIIPNFSDEKIASIAKEHYGLEGSVTALVSYEDQNALIKTGNGKFVLKISNTKWPKTFIQTQINVLEHLKVKAPHLAFPSTVATLSEEELIEVDGFYVRLQTFLEGEIYTNMPKSETLYADLGRFLGQLSQALCSFNPEHHEGSDPLWKLDRVIDCKPYVKYVADDETRDRMNRIFDAYEEKVLPKLPKLRKAIIHSDANEQNFLVLKEKPDQIYGLIDFGELQHASQINELAITLAYCLMGEDDIEMASKALVDGYDKEFKILDEEREILFYLMAMRVIVSVTMSAYNASLQPDNEYLLVTQKPGIELLKRMEELKFIDI